MLDPDRPLVKLAGLIDWPRFDAAFGRLYTPLKVRPGRPTRLTAGLHLLQHMEGLSDEAFAHAGSRIPTISISAASTISATIAVRSFVDDAPGSSWANSNYCWRR